MSYRTLLFLLGLFLPAILPAQQLDHVLGEALIRLEPKTDIAALSARLQWLDGQPTQFKVVKPVSAYMRIWRVSFDHNAISEVKFLAHLNRMPGIEVAQFNHLVELRSTVPNDPGFANQWQYINTGLGECVEGADIDADLAWGITTGGQNALGHDIVVCIVDDGLDPSHQDFGDNVWVNVAEIPDNGIDDDNNGFVDDYAGWNTGSDNDDIDEINGHGTPVAGIVGAQGNNGIGVAGVNWDVKLMIVVGGSGVESEVLEAYSFPLAHRMRYNETNGAEGSFVVATNSSWGVNFGQPENAPLWCAFYDTLGVHGILNAGATINGNQNVDEVGDLPTACASDFMISVTNLNCTGNKVTGAGFGVETIDLGAPGQGTWTAADGNSYGGFGGTSGATPHVAGAIALLYSAPCPQLTQLALENPEAAARLVRQSILDGTRPNSSLDGITVTGGMLNLNNSLQLLLQNCGPCPGAFALEATATDSSALVSWVSTDSTLSSNLLWRPLGDTVWTVLPDTVAPVLLQGLQPCTAYEFAVEDACADTTALSSAATFLTDGCCDAPQGLAAAVSIDSTVLSWQGGAAAQAYRVEVVCPFDTLVFDQVFEPTLTLSGLDSCQACLATVQSLCSENLPPDSLGTSLIFEVPGCGNCIDLGYCEPQGSTSFEFLQAVAVNGEENVSGNDGGYGDYTGFSFTLETGALITISLTPGWVGDAYPEDYWVWADLNQDGEFDFEQELLGSVEASTDEVVTISAIIPEDTPIGSTRLRVAMAYENSPTPACGVEIEGETEDYCLEIVDEVPPCSVPQGLSTGLLAYQSAGVSWSGSAAGYLLRYRADAAAAWSILEVEANTAVTLDGLELCTGYTAQVAGLCSDGIQSAWSVPVQFFTLCNPDCSTAGAQLAAGSITDTTVMLAWQPSSQAISYEIELRQAGAASWAAYTTEGLEQAITGLAPCTAYEARLRATCEGVNNISAPSPMFAFETTCLTGLAEAVKVENLSVAPNPFGDQLQVRWSLPVEQDVTFTLYNSSGQAVLREAARISGKAFRTWPTSQLPAGLYWLEVQLEDGVQVLKAVKE